MAKSLKCNDCGLLLASVKEAQTHNDTTGHANFSETTEVLKVMACTSCGKKCRTQAEKEMHQRFTGHSEFTEQANDAMELDTEKQMADAKDELMDEADFIKKQVKGGGAAAAAAAKAGSSSGAAAAAGTSAAAEGEGAAAAEGGGEMVAPAVDEALVTELEGMGFGRNRCVRAVYHTGGGGVEAAVNWLMEHEKDADLDTALLVTQASEDVSAKLTPEERRNKAAALIKAAKEKREKEERELAVHRERERIRAGKEMQLAKKKDDDLALKRVVEQRAREKAEEAAARAKIQARLEEDKKERRRKLGLPEELTEEEKAREAQKAAERAAAEEASKKKAIFGHVKPVSTLEKMRSTLVAMKKEYAADEQRWRTCAATLSKYIANVGGNPDEDKFRSIKLSNAAFQQRVGGLHGSVDFLHLCGFQTEASPDGELLRMPRDKVDRDVLEGAMSYLNEMQTNAFFGAL